MDIEKAINDDYQALFYPEPMPDMTGAEPEALPMEAPAGSQAVTPAEFGMDIGNLVKGVATGAAGLAGDVLSIGRGLFEIGRRGGDESAVDAFLKGMEAGTFVPTTENINQWIDENVGLPERMKGGSVPGFIGEVVAPGSALTKTVKGVGKLVGGARKATESAPSIIKAPDTVFQDITAQAYDGYKVERIPNIQATRKITKLVNELDAGKIDEATFQRKVRYLASDMADVAEQKADKRIMTERARGADVIRERLINARRTESIDTETVDFALWALDKNPNIADKLGIGVVSKEAGNAAGDYNPAAMIMRVFKGKAESGTAVHEILHHSERMMPSEVQQGIMDEWTKQYTKAIKGASPEQRTALENILPAMAGDNVARKALDKAFADGVLTKDAHYQFVNPSEFWSVNATDILSGRYAADGKWVAQAKQWLKEMVEKAKGLVGLPSNAPVIKALNEIMNTSGEFKSKKMIAEVAAKPKPVANRGGSATMDKEQKAK